MKGRMKQINVNVWAAGGITMLMLGMIMVGQLTSAQTIAEIEQQMLEAIQEQDWSSFQSFVRDDQVDEEVFDEVVQGQATSAVVQNSIVDQIGDFEDTDAFLRHWEWPSVTFVIDSELQQGTVQMNGESADFELEEGERTFEAGRVPFGPVQVEVSTETGHGDIGVRQVISSQDIVSFMEDVQSAGDWEHLRYEFSYDPPRVYIEVKGAHESLNVYVNEQRWETELRSGLEAGTEGQIGPLPPQSYDLYTLATTPWGKVQSDTETMADTEAGTYRWQPTYDYRTHYNASQIEQAIERFEHSYIAAYNERDVYRLQQVTSDFQAQHYPFFQTTDADGEYRAELGGVTLDESKMTMDYNGETYTAYVPARITYSQRGLYDTQSNEWNQLFASTKNLHYMLVYDEREEEWLIDAMANPQAE